MGAVGTFAIGTVGIPVTLTRSPPTATITTPTSVHTSSSLTVAWTYNSPTGRAQYLYQVRLFTAAGTLVHTSGLKGGTAATYAIPDTLSSFTTYEVEVRVWDNLLDNTTSSVTFLVELAEEDVAVVNPNVGSVYEVGIDGVGYMLADHPDGKYQYRRKVSQIDPQRLATGDTPFSEAVERYSFIGHTDWTGGEGQRYLNRPNSDPQRYFYSEGINPFEPGELTTLPVLTKHITSAHTNQQCCVASDLLFVVTSATQLTSRNTPGGVNTAFNHGLAGAVISMTSDGTYWYVTDGTTIRRNNVAVDPAANWSVVALGSLGWINWCTDRLVGLDNTGGTVDLVTFDSAGVEVERFTHTASELKGVCGGDGFVWWGVNRGSHSSYIRYWRVDSSPDELGTALTLPAGERVSNLFFYLGNVFVASRAEVTGEHKIYRCVPSEGLLTPQLIEEMAHFSSEPSFFAGMGQLVAFDWPDMQRTGESGIGVVDLESGGVARWHAAGATSGPAIDGIVRWNGAFGFTVSGEGFWGKSTSTTYGSGFLETSTADLATSIFKYLDSISVTTMPLDGEVEVKWSTNLNESFNSAGTFETAGATSYQVATGVLGSSIGLRVDLTPTGGGVAPIVTAIIAKTHPKGLSDVMLVLPVNCADRLTGVNGQELDESGQGTGFARAKALEALIGRQVLIQDVDWPITSSTMTMQVLDVDTISVGLPNRHANHREDHAVAVVTLRAAIS